MLEYIWLSRLAILARYRERLQPYCDARLVITVDRDCCLLIYPEPTWIESVGTHLGRSSGQGFMTPERQDPSSVGIKLAPTLERLWKYC